MPYWLRQRLSRRGMIVSGIATAGLSASGALLAGRAEQSGTPHGSHTSSGGPHAGDAPASHDAHGNMISVGDVDSARNGFNPSAMLVDWETGAVSQLPDGRTLRSFEITAVDKEIEIVPGSCFRLGPTMDACLDHRCA